VKQPIITLVLLFSFIGIIKADIWFTPEITFYKSQNGIFELKVVPSSYTTDPLFENEIKNDSCVGTLYKYEGSDTILIWSKKLINEDCPLNAIVSNDGNFVVTFDDWYGSSINAVVIYNNKGMLLKKFGLYDIVPRGIIFEESSTQIFWGGKHKFSENNSHLVLEISAIKNLKKAKEKSTPLKIKLSDGTIIENKRLKKMINKKSRI